jgi:hypothetical protein
MSSDKLELLLVQLATMSQFDDLLGLLRAPDTGYESPAFALACRAEEELSWVVGSGPRAVWLRIWRGALPQLCYRLRAPAVTVALTGASGGRMIGEHLAIREHARPRYRHAQGVLPLPADYSDYLRGRRRQAIRTNLGHAHRAGLTVQMRTDPKWRPGAVDSRASHISPGPVEEWTVHNRDGEVVGASIVSVDDRVALLHRLVARERYARWLLHAAIVERLCGHCELLLINSDAAYWMSRGGRHSPHLLGYRIASLRVARRRRVLPAMPWGRRARRRRGEAPRARPRAAAAADSRG